MRLIAAVDEQIEFGIVSRTTTMTSIMPGGMTRTFCAVSDAVSVGLDGTAWTSTKPDVQLHLVTGKALCRPKEYHKPFQSNDSDTCETHREGQKMQMTAGGRPKCTALIRWKVSHGRTYAAAVNPSQNVSQQYCIATRLLIPGSIIASSEELSCACRNNARRVESPDILE
jgi:hypothetical protein